MVTLIFRFRKLKRLLINDDFKFLNKPPGGKSNIYGNYYYFFLLLGIDVEFPFNVENLERKFRLRCLLLLVTADYPAHQELGKFSHMGTFPCRRDKVKGTVVKLQIFYLLFIKKPS